MRRRGGVYWAWSDPTLHHQFHEETLYDGTFIDVQVRLSRTGGTQLFLGATHAPAWHCMKRLTAPGPANRCTGRWPGALTERVKLLMGTPILRPEMWLRNSPAFGLQAGVICQAGYPPGASELVLNGVGRIGPRLYRNRNAEELPPAITDHAAIDRPLPELGPQAFVMYRNPQHMAVRIFSDLGNVVV